MNVLRIFLFGGMRLYYGDQKLATIPTRKARSLFAYLATYRGQAHARARLAGLFWGDASEDRAQHSLSTALWRIRRVVPPDYLLSDARGVAFNTDLPYWLDIEAFEQVLIQAESHPEPRGQHLQTAVALYRGDFLAGQYDDWALVEAERLRWRFLAALEALFEDYIAAKDVQSALEIGQTILARDPLREDVYRRMMALYWQAGNAAAAMRLYEQCRQTLQLEMDVAPGAHTTALYERIVASPSAHAPTPTDLATPAATPIAFAPTLSEPGFLQTPFIGRGSELNRLQQHVAALRRGEGRSVWIEGETGIGKSRLVRRFCLLQAAAGIDSLVATDADLPHLVQQALLRYAASDLLSVIPEMWLSVLAAHTPALRRHFPHLQTPQPISDPATYTRQLEAMVQCLIGLARLNPLILVLEDWREANAATRTAASLLLNRIRRNPVLLIVTSRQSTRAHSQGTESLLPRFDDHICLKPFTQAETAQFVHQALALAHPAPNLTAHLHHESAGNPLFIGQMLHALADTGALNRMIAPGWRPEREKPKASPARMDIEQIIATRLQRLDADARHVLEQAAVLGRGFPLAILQEALSWRPERLQTALQRVQTGQWVEIQGDLVRFPRSKLREVILDALPAPRARELHRLAALAWQKQEPDRVEALARHFAGSGRQEQALIYAMRAGARAQKNHHFDAAIDHYARALTLAPSNHASTAAILTHLAELHYLSNETEQALTYCEQALSRWERLQRSDMLAHCHNALSQIHLRLGNAADMGRHARSGVAHAKKADHIEEMLNGYRLLARHLFFEHKLNEMAAVLEQAMPLAIQHRAWYWLAEYERLLGDLALLQQGYHQALAHDLRANSHFIRVGVRQDRQAMLYNNMAEKQCRLGKLSLAMESAAQGLTLARQAGALMAQGVLQITLANLHFLQDQREQAWRDLEQAKKLAEEIQNRRLQDAVRIQHGHMALWENHIAEALAILQETTEHSVLYIDQGYYIYWLRLAEARLLAGDATAAEQAIARALATTPRGNKVGSGEIERLRGRLRAVQGDLSAAQAHFQTAIEHFHACQAFLDEAATLLALGEALLRWGSVAPAREHLETAYGRFLAMGAAYYARRVRTALEGEPITVFLARRSAPGGRPLRPDERITVRWSLDNGGGDAQLREQEGPVALRRARIIRLCAEAETQGAAPTIADLAQALGVSARTIKRDVAALRAAGTPVATRGAKGG